MSTKLPKKIKILHKDYDLVERTDAGDVLSNGNYGNHYPVLNKIEWIRTNKPSENVDTIIHELLHALLHTFYVKVKDEEHVVVTLATGLTTVMKDNPVLFKELLNMLK